MPTDKEIFGKDERTRTQTNGRPKVNRDLVRRLLQSRSYSDKQIANAVDSSTRTIRRIRQELIESGDLPDESKGEQNLNFVELDFDEECKRAMGYSFYEWLKNSNKGYAHIFNFNRRVWENLWNRPSLILVRDQDSQLGDELCQKFLQAFGEDTKRIRARKKRMRYIFRFLGRTDLCDRHLRMTKSRDPLSVREVPEITMEKFPQLYADVVEQLESEMGSEIATAIRFKTVTQMRTGKKSAERGLMGMKVGSGYNSYIIMNSVDDYRIRVNEKGNEFWDITWIPRSIREELFELVQMRENGEFLWSFSVAKLRKAFKRITDELLGIKMNPHDIRKISVTWLYVCNVPLEIATQVNVGWKDLNTPKEHYLQLRNLLKRSEKRAYRENIPAWFKQGLEEYAQTDQNPREIIEQWIQEQVHLNPELATQLTESLHGG